MKILFKIRKKIREIEIQFKLQKFREIEFK